MIRSSGYSCIKSRNCSNELGAQLVGQKTNSRSDPQNCREERSVCNHHRKNRFWRTFLASKENFPGRWLIPKPYRNQENHIHHRNLSSVAPIFSAKKSSSLEQGSVYFFPQIWWEANFSLGISYLNWCGFRAQELTTNFRPHPHPQFFYISSLSAILRMSKERTGIRNWNCQNRSPRNQRQHTSHKAFPPYEAPSLKTKIFISCYRTPGPRKGFRRVSEGVSEGF